jgi:hypothetical protein
MKKPIFNHREIIGFATNAKQAERIIRSKLSVIPDSFQVIVKERSELMQEMLNSPEGFIYSVVMK